MGLGATVIDADGTIHDSVVDFALCYALSNHIDPFGMRTTPATGWAMLADGSPISSTISDRDAYYTMARDHRATAGNIVTTSGRGMRLVFSGPGTSMHALSKTETGFTVIDKSTIGGTLGVARYPIQEYFSGSRASLNSPSTFDTFTWGSQVSSVSGEYPVDAIVFGSLIYTHTLGPTDFFNSATVAVDVTNLITAHVDIANAEEYQTVRHTIDSGGVITALDVRSGMFLADRINDTQAVEIDVTAHQFSLVDMATGALSSPIALPGGSTIVAVAGDYGVGNIFYTIDSASVIRKHDSTGALLATIDTGFLAIYPPSFMLSADHLFVQRQSVLLQWAGWYVLDKDLTGVGLISRSVIGQTGPGGFQAVNDNNPVPFSATPDTAEIVALLPNMTNALATMGSVSTVPAIAGVRISQISETVGKGYPLELVI
jgi:hypothetical protein